MKYSKLFLALNCFQVSPYWKQVKYFVLLLIKKMFEVWWHHLFLSNFGNIFFAYVKHMTWQGKQIKLDRKTWLCWTHLENKGKKSKFDIFGPWWTLLDHFGQFFFLLLFWNILDPILPFWTILNHLGSCWTILDNFEQLWIISGGFGKLTSLDKFGPF